jgi:hypothetical protein
MKKTRAIESSIVIMHDPMNLRTKADSILLAGSALALRDFDRCLDVAQISLDRLS